MKRHGLGLIVLFVMWGFAPAQALTIKAVKGKQVLIELDGEETAEGDLMFATSPEGKRVGLIRVQKVQGSKALGQLVKGRASQGWQATLAKSPKAQMATPVRRVTRTHSYPRILLGALAGAGMDSQTVVIAATNISLTGIGFSGYGLMDYHFNQAISLRALVGAEMFNSSALINLPLCEGNSTSCNMNFVALSGGGILRWTFLPGDVGIWGGIGGYYLFPLSKTSTVVEADTIPASPVVAPAFGVDVALNSGLYLTFQAEYGIFLNSEWNAKWIAGRGGLAFSF